MIRLRTLTRSPIARKIRRYRRPLAAAFAALSVVFMVSALRPPPPMVVTEPEFAPLAQGEVGVPITLATTSVTAVIRSGDIVDVIALTETGSNLLANKVRIVDVFDGGLIVLAARPDQAVELAAAALQQSLTVTIHPHPPLDE